MTVAQRIGYSFGPLLSMEELISCAKMADEFANVDSLWVPESWGRESFATLGAMSQVTRRSRLGTSIINIYSRTPATVAMAATTVDFLSSCRTVIGLGVSTETIIENWHGLRFEKPLQRMKEFVSCLRLMIAGDKVNFNGKFFQIRNFSLLHHPSRKQIPIFIAAVNKKMVSLASESGDGILLYLRPRDELKKTAAAVRHLSGNRPFEIASSFICAMSKEQPEKARWRAAKTLAFYVAVGKYYGQFLSENGFANEILQIREAYKRNGGDAAAEAVSDNMLDALTICGTPEECLISLKKFIAAGVTLPIIQLNPVAGSESSFRELLSTF